MSERVTALFDGGPTAPNPLFKFCIRWRIVGLLLLDMVGFPFILDLDTRTLLAQITFMFSAKTLFSLSYFYCITMDGAYDMTNGWDTDALGDGYT